MAIIICLYGTVVTSPAAYTPGIEVAPLLDLTPLRALGQAAEEIAVATTGLEHATSGLEVTGQQSRQFRRRLHAVVAEIVAVGLETHDEFPPASPPDSSGMTL